MYHIADPPPADQVSKRIRAIASKANLGERTAGFIAALVEYWSTTYDMTQRQAKNAQREGEQLTLNDARRVVFHIAVVMHEVSRLPIVVAT